MLRSDCLTRYSRRIDRMDRELLLSAYHEDAIDDHGTFVGNREELADYAATLIAGNARLAPTLVEFIRTYPRVARDHGDVYYDRPSTVNPERIRRGASYGIKPASCSRCGAFSGVT